MNNLKELNIPVEMAVKSIFDNLTQDLKIPVETANKIIYYDFNYTQTVEQSKEHILHLFKNGELDVKQCLTLLNHRNTDNRLYPLADNFIPKL